ncbi:MAG: hypothetical protein IPH31_05335 [Lewinellaceae bacterium]|nr:hypothetical protein [Lewinellaceae bacterium]
MKAKDKEDVFSLMDMEKLFDDLNDANNELGLGNIGTLLKSLFQLQPAGIEITEENRDALKKMFPNLKPTSTMWDLMKDVGPFSKKLLQDGDFYKDFRETLKQGFKLDLNSGNWSYEEVIKT